MQCSPRRGNPRQEAAKTLAFRGRSLHFQRGTGPPAPLDSEALSRLPVALGSLNCATIDHSGLGEPAVATRRLST